MQKIDLRSDTVTQPTFEMRQAMAAAEVGDDGWEDDPTVKLLEATAAELLGKEAALFVASGTMGNLVSVLTHCQQGEEIIVGSESHLYYYEYGGVSALGGVILRTLTNERDGTLNLDALESAIRPQSMRFPKTSLICLENTQNRCSGRVLSPEYTAEVTNLAHQKDIAVHLDGARIFNASVALGIPVSKLTKSIDSVTFCLSKGLSCPIGSIVCGSQEFITRARRIRAMLGGGMRQVGIIAAAGLVALETMVDRLLEDHINAQQLATGLSRIKAFSVDSKAVESNIVIFDLLQGDASLLVKRLAEAGLLISQYGTDRLRMVTHYGIGKEDIETALGTIEQILRQFPA
jgi:threonine aldolase